MNQQERQIGNGSGSSSWAGSNEEQGLFPYFLFSLKHGSVTDLSKLRRHGGGVSPSSPCLQLETGCLQGIDALAKSEFLPLQVPFPAVFFPCSSFLSSLCFLSAAGNEGVGIPFPSLLFLLSPHISVPHPEVGGAYGGPKNSKDGNFPPMCLILLSLAPQHLGDPPCHTTTAPPLLKEHQLRDAPAPREH